MPQFQLLAQPLWVNLFLLIPPALFFLLAKQGHPDFLAIIATVVVYFQSRQTLDCRRP